MEDPLSIDLICLTVFEFLDIEDLQNCKQVNNFWNFLIERYFHLPKEFCWARYSKEFAKIGCQGKTKFDYHAINCHRSGIRFLINIRDDVLCIDMEHIYHKKMIKSVQYNLNATLQSSLIQTFFVAFPRSFCSDYKLHNYFYIETNQSTFQKIIILFDYTNMSNLIFHQLCVNRKSETLCPSLSEILDCFKDSKLINDFEEVHSTKNRLIVKQQNNYFAVEQDSLYWKLEIKSLNSPNPNFYRIFENAQILKIHCKRYAISFHDDSQTVRVFDLSSCSSEPIMCVPRKQMFKNNYYSYYVSSIDLSAHHFIILFGLMNHSRNYIYQFYYMMIDAANIKHSFFARKESHSFIHNSFVESQIDGTVFVHDFHDFPKIVVLDLNNLCIVET